MKTERKCSMCEADISDLHHNAKMCKRCSIVKNGSFDDLVKYDPSVLETKVEGRDYVRCCICGYYASDLSKHLKLQEKISLLCYDLLLKRIISMIITNPHSLLSKEERMGIFYF